MLDELSVRHQDLRCEDMSELIVPGTRDIISYKFILSCLVITDETGTQQKYQQAQ